MTLSMLLNARMLRYTHIKTHFFIIFFVLKKVNRQTQSLFQALNCAESKISENNSN